MQNGGERDRLRLWFITIAGLATMIRAALGWGRRCGKYAYDEFKESYSASVVAELIAISLVVIKGQLVVACC